MKFSVVKYEGDMLAKTLSVLLLEHCTEYSDSILFETKGTPITYRQFLSDINNLAKKHFKNFKREKVLILASTSYKWAVVYFGIVTSGGVAVLADPQLNPDQLNELCSKYQIKTVVSDFALNLQAANISVINFDDIEINVKNNLSYQWANILEDEVCTIAFTSGTTDIAKGVMLSHKNLYCNVYAGCSIYEYKSSDIILNVLPFYNLFGLTCVLLASIASGNKIVFSSISTFFNDLKTVNPTFLLLVPEIAKFLLIKINQYGLETVGNCLEKILCGGAQIGEQIVENYKKLGISVSSCYGITECSPGVAINPVANGKNGTAGKIMPCNEVRISEYNQEILVKGSNVMIGYYDNPELTKQVIADGWFHTGDIGFIEDGFLSVTGRIKNLMVFDSGKKVSPEEIEYKFLYYPEIDEIVVYKDNDQICAKIFSKIYLKNKEIYKTILDIVEEVNVKLPIYKRVNKFEMINLPFSKTHTNKIKRGNR